VYLGNCPTLTLIACDDNPPTQGHCKGGGETFIKFSATAGNAYHIQVGSAAGAVGGGLLTLIGPTQSGPQCPPGGAPLFQRVFRIIGNSTGAGWTWCLRAPCCMNLQGSVAAGVVPANASAKALRDAFVASINGVALAANCPPGALQADALTGDRFRIRVRGCPPLALPRFALSVGPANTPCDDLCVVPDVPGPGPDPLPTAGPCSFNPNIIEVPLAGTDCNNNGEDDAIDILLGTSPDANGDGVPDECGTCEAPVIVEKPTSQTTAPGESVTFAVRATGTDPLHFAWHHDGMRLDGQETAMLTITNAQPADAGEYFVVISNVCGQVTSAPVTLTVSADGCSALRITQASYAGNTFTLSFETQAGLSYTVEYKNALSDGTWTTLQTLTGTGAVRTVQDTSAVGRARFYRVVCRREL
jgi:hypothetical protein